MTILKNETKKLQLIHKPKRLKCYTYSLTAEERNEIRLQRQKLRALNRLERKLKKHQRKK